MKKFKIEEYTIDNQYDGSTFIKMAIRPNGILSTDDIKGLKETIENIDSDHYIYCGRGNGKTKYFSDWMRGTLIADNIAEAARFGIKQVIFSNPATIVFWGDGTKTVVKCQDGDEFIPETGIAMCFMKKALGNKSNFNNTFKKHISIVEKRAAVFVADLKKFSELTKKKPTKTYAHLNTEAIYRILRENKWTVKELAKVVGVDHTSVCHWLRGGGIKKTTLNKLSKVLHISEEDLVK